jgi:hypothetical protein
VVLVKFVVSHDVKHGVKQRMNKIEKRLKYAPMHWVPYVARDSEKRRTRRQYAVDQMLHIATRISGGFVCILKYF